jgi:hypothetical protein
MELKLKTSLDTRLQYAMLTDRRLQRSLTDAEFKAFINLLVWSVSLVSDGVFKPDDAEMVAETAHIPRLVEVGVIECDDAGNYCIAEAYQSWQTSAGELRRRDEQREANRLRKSEWRKRQADGTEESS